MFDKQKFHTNKKTFRRYPLRIPRKIYHPRILQNSQFPDPEFGGRPWTSYTLVTLTFPFHFSHTHPPTSYSQDLSVKFLLFPFCSAFVRISHSLSTSFSTSPLFFSLFPTAPACCLDSWLSLRYPKLRTEWAPFPSHSRGIFNSQTYSFTELIHSSIQQWRILKTKLSQLISQQTMCIWS